MNLNNLSSRVKKFLAKYDIKVLSDSKRYARISSLPTFFTSSSDKNIVQNIQVPYESEPLLTVDIPLSRLQSLADIEAIFFNNIDDVSARRVFQLWIDQQNEERRLRDAHPAVAKAYEHYSAMLTWCGQNHSKTINLPPEE